MATIKDVAKRAGVSVATVSRVMNAADTVKDDTRAIVEKAIEELNYSPNELGRGLRRNATMRILVVLSTISNQFHSRVLRGIEDTAGENGYSVLIGTTRDRMETLARYHDMLRTRQVDGAIFMSTHLKDREEIEFFGEGYPVVCACEPMEGIDVSYVGINDYQAAADATEYLISLGHRRISLLTGGTQMRTSGSAWLREQGFRSVMEAHGLPVEENLIIAEGVTYNAGRRAAARYLAMEQLPDAVFSCSDAGAVGLINSMWKAGVRVPEKLSVMGFDNIAVSEVIYPSVTTIAQPQYEIGQKAMEMLLARLNHTTEKTETIYLPHTLIERESTMRHKA